ncbi:Transcription factor RFX3 [Papilio xuthus]|uniref:Transcription factor RFX3 n=1 Tax=Papilio xuthus TaxID=66420 RepID=A0A194Q9G8_PAPXU|nr:Transcription factor RFX3 [Papilio xuthus]
MTEMAFENVFYLENFECAGDEVLVESSPPASPDMAARLAAPAQGAAPGAGEDSPTAVRELIVIPEMPSSIHLQHAIQQVSSTVVEINGDSSGHSSPTADPQHTYITVASESGNGVNYHVQYMEPQELYAQGHQPHMEQLRTYPVYNVADVANGQNVGLDVGGVAGVGVGVGVGVESAAEGAWGGDFTFATSNTVAAAEPDAPASPAAPARMPPATVQWLLDHYETAEGVSLPRSSLYAHYLRHCAAHRLEPVNAASFGKLIRSVFVGLRTRRLGTRGNSKYHYYGIRAKLGADSPLASHGDNQDTDLQARDALIYMYAETYNTVERQGGEGEGVEGAEGAGGPHRQYFGCPSPPEPPELRVTSLPPDIPLSALDALRKHHREHGAELLSAVAALDIGGVERARRVFWRRPRALCRRLLVRLCARRAVARWLLRADLQLHQAAVDLLLPDVLHPIPSHLTQSIRNFAKLLEGALSAGGSGAPAQAVRAQGAAAAALAAALRRYTSLNHLAQAARAVLVNHTQIEQMLADLNRVDFRVVREQAAWACSCGSSSARSLEHDFKKTSLGIIEARGEPIRYILLQASLGRSTTLEQWADWLDGCVRNALAVHERRPDYVSRARRLLLDWSFYSSLVIRELTLRSAASFGSFHLIRLLYDEYVSYLIERRVALHTRQPQIAVMQRALEEEEDDLLIEAREGELEGEGEEEEMEQEPEPEQEAEQELELEQDQEWEWADDDDDDDDVGVEVKKAKTN